MIIEDEGMCSYQSVAQKAGQTEELLPSNPSKFFTGRAAATGRVIHNLREAEGLEGPFPHIDE